MSSQAITAEHLQALGALPGKVDALQARLRELAGQIEQLAARRPPSTIVPIQSLDDEELRLKKSPYIVVEEFDDSFIATFFDAHISSSGDTLYEAVDNVKDLISATFRRLRTAPPEKLGPLPTKQLVVLREFLDEKR